MGVGFLRSLGKELGVVVEAEPDWILLAHMLAGGRKWTALAQDGQATCAGLCRARIDGARIRVAKLMMCLCL